MAIGDVTKKIASSTGKGLVKGAGFVGGAALGGAGLIAASVSQSIGTAPLIAGAAALGGAGVAGWKKLAGGVKSKQNTISDKNLSDNSKPSDVEEGEVSILDKILTETDNLVNVLKSQQVPESTKRELQLDKDVRHKELVAAFLSLEGPKGDTNTDDGEKKNWLSKLWEMIKKIAAAIIGWKLFIKPLIGLISRFAKFAARMLLVFVSPAMLGVMAAVYIMANWKNIKKNIKSVIAQLKTWANKVSNFLGFGDVFDMAEPEPIVEEEPTFTLPLIEGEPGIEPTAPEEFDVYEESEVVPDANEFLGQDGTTVTFTPEELEAQGLEIDDAGRLVSADESIVDDITTAPDSVLTPDDITTAPDSVLTPASVVGPAETLEGIDTQNLQAMEANRLVGETDAYDVGAGSSQAALGTGVGGTVTPTTAPTVTPKQQKRKGDPTRKDLPTGMFAASYAPAESTGIGWLDNLYAQDASMRYEKAFTQNTEIGKVQPKIINTGSTVDNSVRTSSTTQNQTFKTAPHLVANNNTVAVFTNK